MPSLALFSLVFLLAYSAPSLAAENKPVTPSSIRGLNPALYDKYEPNPAGTFQCLDGSKIIKYSAINDDYCDCPDGSDEPGTSACHNGVFWCKNQGHIPGQVLSSRVNDGICDPECCDGSDEWATGACPDKCAEIGKKFREEEEAIRKTRKTGSKVRGTYIKWAQGEKTRLESELESKKKEVKDKEQEVEKARVALEKTESKSKEDLEKKKLSPLYQSLLTHRLTLTRLRSKSQRLQSELDTLHSLLDELSKGYNPNYQDMAVKAAVVGYEELTGKAAASPSEEEKPQVDQPPQEQEEEIKDWELDELERKDLEGLLWQAGPEDEGDDDDEEEGGLLWKIDEYIPDSLYDSWEGVRDTAIEWMIRLGLIGKKKASKTSIAEGPHVAAAREKHRNLSNELNKLNNAITNTENTLEKMDKEYGPQAEWKKLDGVCVDKVSGDYTYELCFFGKATQKSNKDGATNHMGTFSGWNTAAEQGSFDYYTKQLYKNGARCWNGPLRSVAVDLSCGTQNALLSISEPEKCEYRYKVTTPALCWPDETEGGEVKSEDEEKIKEEL
ncbi:hypothetical protein I302_103315 [Kwoniella bestiolae CBS 10118]|uniref:Glucosidase 2 subunit beta n=1 Tax=Kwoniella bestiolae CBS 10118 TaxID=1296100 RepID=A0A1B9G870_9TREE|nr:protein kinase C substrate 80K-H [Kwoniella bestiolae CBS 10118]OCF27180.1 protein kinase C substrate 80K-H [Kwoniella bestiolae CBS 10118]